jgi:hypothetical protein
MQTNFTLTIEEPIMPNIPLLINKGIEIWNSLDEKISNIRSYFTFKIKSKIFFLEYI